MAKRGYSIAGRYTDEHRARVDALPARYPNVTVEWVDAGHLIHWERPDEVAARIAAFARAAAG